MDWWNSIAHGIRQQFRAVSESARSDEHSADLTRVFSDAEIVSLQAANDIKEGTLAFRFTASGATLTVTEIEDDCYLCCYKSSSSWFSSPETEYYRFSGYAWLDLVDTLVSLLALGWKLDYSTTELRQRHLVCEDQSSDKPKRSK
ncbi:MAG TPA: hypothetical protein VFJ06_07565 [Halococcus sp.]|nr:hypothetical protein [Halococcus sp.]